MSQIILVSIKKHKYMCIGPMIAFNEKNEVSANIEFRKYDAKYKYFGL